MWSYLRHGLISILFVAESPFFCRRIDSICKSPEFCIVNSCQIRLKSIDVSIVYGKHIDEKGVLISLKFTFFDRYSSINVLHLEKGCERFSIDTTKCFHWNVIVCIDFMHTHKKIQPNSRNLISINRSMVFLLRNSKMELSVLKKVRTNFTVQFTATPT